jgi:hypothetical protein
MHQRDGTRKIHNGQRQELRRLRDQQVGKLNLRSRSTQPLEIVDRLSEVDIRDE